MFSEWHNIGRRVTQIFVMAIVSVFLANTRAVAESLPQGPVFTLIEENDLVVNTDRHYTQGIKLSYLHADDYLPFGSSNAFERIPQIAFRNEFGKFGYVVGQSMYTPGDINVPTPQPNDRPYAGWLYAGAVLQRRGPAWGGIAALESFELQLGVIGPGSLAREAQTWVHQIRGFGLPQGWGNQLKNEPGLRLNYLRAARMRTTRFDPLELDFIPHAGMSLGNLETSGRLGGTFRLGVRLPDDFGIQTIDSLSTISGGVSGNGDAGLGIYVFASSEGRVVARNAFLDGNLFRAGPSVEKEILVGDFKAGFAVAWRRAEIGFTQVFRTPEFHGQSEHDAFGSVFFKLRF